MIEPDAWYTMQKSFRLVSKETGIRDIKSFRGLIEQKKIKANKVGFHYRIKGEWLTEFLAKWDAGDFQ